MAKVTVSYEFDYWEDNEQLKMLSNHRDAYSVLCDIDQEIRSRLKWPSDKETEEAFLERIRGEIYGVIE